MKWSLSLICLAACMRSPSSEVVVSIAEPVAPAPVAPVEPPQPQWPVELARVSVVAVGDLLMHTNVKRSAAAADIVDDSGVSTNSDGFAALFEQVAHLIADADLAFANLETPVAPVANKGTRSMVFNVSPSLLPALVDTGFDVVSFANNHVYDQGRDGFVETMQQLDSAGMPFVGAGATCADAARARHFDVDGVDIAIIGSTLVYNSNLNRGPDDPCAFTLEESTALASAQQARDDGANLVVLSVHWGEEYETTPRKPHVELAQRLVEGGIDVIWGHHSHVVQPVQTVRTADGRTAVIAYSLGNFISNQRYDYRFGVSTPDRGNPRDGLMLRFEATKTDHGPDASGQHRVKTEITAVEPIVLWTDNSASRAVEVAPTIRTVVLQEALAAARDEQGDAQVPSQRLQMLELREAQVQAILGPATQYEPVAAP